jgi:hypothetical protein
MIRFAGSRAACIAAAMIVAMLVTGCPVTYEDIYGYNNVILRNEGDRAILGLYLLLPGDPGRGRNHIETAGGLQPGRSILVPDLENGVYTIIIEYLQNPQNPTSLQTEQVPGVHLQWGENYTWFWYGPPGTIPPGAL